MDNETASEVFDGERYDYAVEHKRDCEELLAMVNNDRQLVMCAVQEVARKWADRGLLTVERRSYNTLDSLEPVVTQLRGEAAAAHIATCIDEILTDYWSRATLDAFDVARGGR